MIIRIIGLPAGKEVQEPLWQLACRALPQALEKSELRIRAAEMIVHIGTDAINCAGMNDTVVVYIEGVIVASNHESLLADTVREAIRRYTAAHLPSCRAIKLHLNRVTIDGGQFVTRAYQPLPAPITTGSTIDQVPLVPKAVLDKLAGVPGTWLLSGLIRTSEADLRMAGLDQGQINELNYALGCIGYSLLS